MKNVKIKVPFCTICIKGHKKYHQAERAVLHFQNAGTNLKTILQMTLSLLLNFYQLTNPLPHMAQRPKVDLNKNHKPR